MKDLKRTHLCGEVTEKLVGKSVIVAGWLNRRRDHGGLLFLDLRDRSGLVQVVLNPKENKEAHSLGDTLRSEYVVAVKGKVQPRPAGTENPKLATGKVEIAIEELALLNASKNPPFLLDEADGVSEDLRLQYRYIDLRRPKMQEALIARHHFALAARNFLSQRGFLEIETPILSKSTPEGARDYLVPSRVNPGNFFALPQSPQLMKQILMVSGMDKYFQITRCFRDEDLRADRQPEFTQIDLEMSFANEEDIFAVTEGMMKAGVKAAVGKEVPTPFKRMLYKEAMELYGTDKPDLRFGLPLVDITPLVAETNFEVFKKVVAGKGIVKGILAPGCAKFSRKEIDDLTAYVGSYGAKGLAWFKFTDKGIESPIAKFFPEAIQNRVAELFGAKTGDMVFFIADQKKKAHFALSALRNWLGKTLALIPAGVLDFTWITDFPLFTYNEEEKRIESEHHPFTSPKSEDIGLIDSDPLQVRSSSYDLVLNGNEVASGSVRIHDPKLQEKIFRILKLSEEDIRGRFGFFVEALQYGAPPHAGIAPGLDRLITLLLDRESIRDVIAFPKTASATDLMTQAPSQVTPEQLKELHIRLIEE